MHHDEGVNGWFLTNLIRDNVYKYDPANYHGPSLYYLTYPFVKLFGLETLPLRVSVAIYGLLMVVLVLFLKRYLGNIGSLIAAFFVAISPGLVFISRYFIHEIFFVFLSLAIVVSVLFFIEKRRAGPFAIGWMALILFVCILPGGLLLATYLSGTNTTALWGSRVVFGILDAVIVYYAMQRLAAWNDGRPIYLILASACVALFFATKETAFITIGTMIIACVSIWVWEKIASGERLTRTWYRNLLIGHALIVASGLYYYNYLMDGWKWLYNELIANPWRPPEYFLFYAMLLLIAVFLVTWGIYLVDVKQTNTTDFTEPVAPGWTSFRAGLGDGKQIALIAAAIVIIFAYLGVLFFSSFFSYKEGIWKAFEAYAIWTKTGNKEHSQNGFFAYLRWGMKVESTILLGSVLGSLVAIVKARHRFAMFTALWAIGLFAAYMIIPYKTPWLALSYILPMCMVGGYGLGQFITSKNTRLNIAAYVFVILGTVVLGYQTYYHNFVRWDDDQMPYVYAHTRRGFLDMIKQIEHYSEKSGKGKDAVIEIVSPDYWPMTWYMRNYTRAGFHGRLVDVTASEMIVAKKKDQDAEVIKKYAEHYRFVGWYPLRPGVDLVLLVRKDLADPDTQDVTEIPKAPSSP
jgi:predicted membrane-bound mannosyltransferase